MVPGTLSSGADVFGGLLSKLLSCAEKGADVDGNQEDVPDLPAIIVILGPLEREPYGISALLGRLPAN